MRFKYSRAHRPPAPVMRVKVRSSRGDIRELDLVVDTGFRGGILIPFNLYEEMGLTLVEVADKYYGVLPIGVPIALHTAVAEVIIGGLRFRELVHAHPLINKRLAGRRLLNKLKLVLDGPKEELEVVTT